MDIFRNDYGVSGRMISQMAEVVVHIVGLAFLWLLVGIGCTLIGHVYRRARRIN